MKWSRAFAFVTMLQLGAFFGALNHQTWRHALAWAAVFFVVTAIVASAEDSK